MKKQLLLLLLVFTAVCSAQQDAWVYFTDKPDADYYFENPLEMLSQRALDRRAAQGIELDELDVPIHQEYIDGVTAATGITVMAKSKWLNALHVRGELIDIAALTSLEFVDSIEYADKSLNNPGRPAIASRQQQVNKTLDVQADFDYGMSTTQIQMLNGHVLHQQDYTGEGMIIAVLDSGFPGVNTAQPFQNLLNNNRILGGYNFVAATDDFYTGNQHGTFVLSTMGGYVEGALVGTAPDASYYLFVTEDTTSENPVEESYWVEAAEMADSLGADVINTSLGYYDFDNPNYDYTYDDLDGQTAFITRGANIAFTRGMICVNSAGNTGSTEKPYVEVPADAANVLTVGAVNYEEQRGSFSSIGPTFDGRLKPDVMALGVAAIYSKTDGEISFGNGTSFASPITAGLVACLWQALPEKTNAEIMDLIKGSADRFNNPDYDYGYGIPNFALALNELSIQELSKKDFVVYPNPANNVFYIALPDDVTVASVIVYNSLGQVVLQQEVIANKAISLSDLSLGFYNYKITSGSKAKTGKLIRQ